MRRHILLLGAALSVGCAKQEAPPPPETPAAPSIDLASIAGFWNVSTTRQGSDSVLVTATIIASADPMMWMLVLPGRDTIPMGVTVSGDSLLTAFGPYESVLRPGVQVSNTGVLHLVDGKLTGPMQAHYAVTSADSVVNLWVSATRTQ